MTLDGQTDKSPLSKSGKPVSTVPPADGNPTRLAARPAAARGATKAVPQKASAGAAPVTLANPEGRASPAARVPASTSDTIELTSPASSVSAPAGPTMSAPGAPAVKPAAGVDGAPKAPAPAAATSKAPPTAKPGASAAPSPSSPVKKPLAATPATPAKQAAAAPSPTGARPAVPASAAPPAARTGSSSQVAPMMVAMDAAAASPALASPTAKPSAGATAASAKQAASAVSPKPAVSPVSKPTAAPAAVAASPTAKPGPPAATVVAAKPTQNGAAAAAAPTAPASVKAPPAAASPKAPAPGPAAAAPSSKAAPSPPAPAAVRAAPDAKASKPATVASSSAVNTPVDCIAVRPHPSVTPPARAGPSLKVISDPLGGLPGDGSVDGGPAAIGQVAPSRRTTGAAQAHAGTAGSTVNAAEAAAMAAAQPSPTKAPQQPSASKAPQLLSPNGTSHPQVTTPPTPQQPQSWRQSLSTSSLPAPAILRLASNQQPAPAPSPTVSHTPQPGAAVAAGAGNSEAASATGAVHVCLECNPGGPCPVSIPVGSLDPGGSGEVMVADLLTAVIKALKARYGTVQAGATVKAFYVNPAAHERRVLPTFDNVPPELLYEGGAPGASIVLQGVTCGEPSATQAASSDAVIPLPGFNGDSEYGGIEPPGSNRISFMSANLAGPSEGAAGAPSAGDGTAPTFMPTRSLLRGSGGEAPGASSMKGGNGLRILGNGHRSVRIRTEENTVETLCVESAAPSATSVCSNWRGGKLPPLRSGGSATSLRRRSAESGLDGDSDAATPVQGGRRSLEHGHVGTVSVNRGRLAATKSSRRLLLVTGTGDSMSSWDPNGQKQTPVQMLMVTESLAALVQAEQKAGQPVAGGDGGKAPPVTLSTLHEAAALGSPAGRRQSQLGVSAEDADASGGVAASPAVGKKPAPLFVKLDRQVSGAGISDDTEGLYFPSPAAEWVELMGPDIADTSQGQPQPSSSGGGGGGCLSFLSIFSSSAKAQQQQQWRSRLRMALKTRDEADLNAWLAFHSGRHGSHDQAELDAALWLALEAKAPELVAALLHGGARADVLRPTGPAAASSKAAAKTGAKTAMGGWTGATSSAAVEGLTPLMRAAELACPPLVELLLQNGADPAAVQPATGWTALHRAVLASPASRRQTSPTSKGGAGAAVIAGTSGRSTSASSDSAAAAAAAGSSAPWEADPAICCAKLLLQRLGLQRASGLATAGQHEDNLLRFAVRHGRSIALRWLLSTGLAPSEDDEDDASCAFLAGLLGLTVEVWDLPPPARGQQGPPQRDPARPTCWLVSTEERTFLDHRRQLLMGAAAGGRVDVLAALLDKPAPYDRLRRDELESSLGALKLAAPRNQRAVEELLTRRAHVYMTWDFELLPALQRLDVSVIAEWLLRDRPTPSELDRAFATVLCTERLGMPVWQDSAAAAVKALLEAGADVDYVWQEGPDTTAHGNTGGSRSLRPLTAALSAPAPAVVRQLMAAGADPRKRDAAGENAVFFAVRVAIHAASNRRIAAGDDDSNYSDGTVPDPFRRVVLSKAGGTSFSSPAGTTGDPVAMAAAAECIAVLVSTEHRGELLGARNDKGVTPAFLAAIADLPQLLTQLCDAGADPWAASAPAPHGAPDAPRELLSGGGAAAASAPAGRQRGSAGGTGNSPGWSVGHEAARCGALSCLALLIGGVPPTAISGSRKAGRLVGPPPSAEMLAARRREALVGAIRGGRVAAARMALDAGAVGGCGSLYEAELTAALALCTTSASAAEAGKLPPPPGTDVVGLNVGTADPPRYEALSSFLSSRAHVYMSWEGEVLPALKAANAGVIRRWISNDVISPADATRALCSLVEMAHPCAVSGVGGGVGNGAESPAGASGLAGQLLTDLSNLSSSAAAAAVRGGGNAKTLAEVAATLVQAGADVNYQPMTAAAGGEAVPGQTLLMQATSKGSLPLVEVLLAMGARVDAEDGAGHTAVDVAVLARQRLASAASGPTPAVGGGAAADCGRRCLEKLLEAYGERRLNTHRTRDGDSALMLAVRAGDSAAVQQLIAAGAEPAAADTGEDEKASAPYNNNDPVEAASSAVGSGAAGGGARSNVHVARSIAGSVAASMAPSGRSLGTFSSMGGRTLRTGQSVGARRGTAVYLAARMDDKPMLHALLRGASNGEGGLDACRQEVHLGALHGGRLALLEASLALPELLKNVATPPSDGGSGSAPMGTAATVSSRLAEQAAVRLSEAQGLMRELDVAAVASGENSARPSQSGLPAELKSPGAASVAGGTAEGGVAPLNPGDVARMRQYLNAKARALELVGGAHNGMAAFYEGVRGAMEGLERRLAERREEVSSRVRDAADAQVKLMAATTRLTASRESVLRSVLARRDAAVVRVEALLDKQLAALAAAHKRAEARASSDVENIVLDMRKLAARKLKEIETKKTEGSTRLEQLERRVDQTWARKMRLLAGNPPTVRVQVNQRMGALMQQLLRVREDLNRRVDQAIRKMELQQRKGTVLVDMEALRAALSRQQQDMAKEIYDAAARAKMVLADTAEELLRHDKHDDLLRIVGQMQAEVTRGSADAAATTSHILVDMQQAFAEAEGRAGRVVEQARKKMQEFLTSVVSRHAAEVKALTEASVTGSGAAGTEGASVLHLPLDMPELDRILKEMEKDLGTVLEGAGPVERQPSQLGDASLDGSGGGSVYSGMRRVAAVQDMIEDMMCDMSEQVLRAFPTDAICDGLHPDDLAVLLGTRDDLSEFNTSSLGIERLREEMRALDFTVPNLDLELRDLDLSPLEDDGPGGSTMLQPGALRSTQDRRGYADDSDEYESSAMDHSGYGNSGYGGGGGGTAGMVAAARRGAAAGRGARRNSDDYGGGGRYNAATYGRPEDDFALSYS